MDRSSVKDLFALQSKVDVRENQRAKSKSWCLIYWIIDKQVSIESLSSVEQEFRKEGKVSDIRFQGGKKYPGKILRISEDKKKLQEEQNEVVESFENHAGMSGDGMDGQDDHPSDMSEHGKRSRKKPSKLVDFVTDPEEEPGTSKMVASAQPQSSKPAMPAKKIVKKADSRATKLKEVADKAKVQQAMCREMLTCKPTPAQSSNEDITNWDSDVDMDDLSVELPKETPHSCPQTEALKGEISSLKAKIMELQNKLEKRDQELLRLQSTAAVDPAPHPFSVAITPKKIKLMQEVTALLQTNQSESASQDSPPASRSTRVIPASPQLAARDTATSPSNTTASTSQNVSLTDETLTPLYLGGLPVLTEREKRVAFTKGTNKEALLFSLLTVVFGEERLAKGKACGLRQAHNIKSEEATVPLDADKLNAIKECVLRRFRLSSGQPCFSPREFNDKINQKCATARRALKKKQANQH